MSDIDVCREEILKIGCEGGGASLYRTMQDGHVVFTVGGSSWGLDENDEEETKSWSSPPFDSLNAALNSIAGDNQWILFHPLFIHPLYCEEVWNLIQETIKSLSTKNPSRIKSFHKHSYGNWHAACNAK